MEQEPVRILFVDDCKWKCHGRQPDSGNPTVRDDTGGLRKRGLWESD